MARAASWLSAAALWAVPSLVYACPVCFNAKDEASRVAFLGTTLFLTGLPLVLIGGVIYWLASRSVEDAERDTPASEPSELPAPGPESTGTFSTR